MMTYFDNTFLKIYMKILSKIATLSVLLYAREMQFPWDHIYEIVIYKLSISHDKQALGKIKMIQKPFLQ